MASNSDAIAKAPHSLAQQTHLRKSLAGASVFDAIAKGPHSLAQQPFISKSGATKSRRQNSSFRQVILDLGLLSLDLLSLLRITCDVSEENFCLGKSELSQLCFLFQVSELFKSEEHMGHSCVHLTSIRS